MQKLFVLFLFSFISLPLFAASVELTPRQKEFVAQNPTVKIALMPDFSPFSYISQDKVVGFEHDLLTLLEQKTGLLFEKEFGIWNKNFQRFKSKNVDIITSISHKKEREPYVKFTTPYYKIPIMIFIRDDFGKYEGLQSLTGKKVGVLKDVFYFKELQELQNIELVVYETYEQITQALVFGKIDALIQNLPNINYLIKKNLYSNLVLADELQLPGITKEDLRFGINPDKPQLHAIIQRGLDSITKQQMQALIDKWIDVKYNSTNSGFTLSKAEKKYLNARIIRYCIDPSFEPFEYLDANAQHAGLTKDYLDK
ncbi:MAG: transporter substrate-binding domain-containing protein, partial [Campylobacterota bacterium]